MTSPNEADTFLQEHPTAYFASDALFQKGWAQYQLQKYDESILTFERFVKQYPFHNSKEGAENWIEKAKSALNEI
jgi:outer membrane protein assembly factor BamD (BamD/ComL family)